jgi:nucleoid-associated protein YgaU
MIWFWPWGDLVFECVLSKVDIKYTLFDRTGLALRAELNTTFIGSIEDAKRVKQEDKKSPDLTRERIVQAGDTLPLIASELYENPSYYLELARVNGLNHFRKLKPGTTLRLPPLGRQDP